MNADKLWISWAGMILLALIPILIQFLEMPVFYTEMFCRIMILALAVSYTHLTLPTKA